MKKIALKNKFQTISLIVVLNAWLIPNVKSEVFIDDKIQPSFTISVENTKDLKNHSVSQDLNKIQQENSQKVFKVQSIQQTKLSENQNDFVVKTNEEIKTNKIERVKISKKEYEDLIKANKLKRNILYEIEEKIVLNEHKDVQNKQSNKGFKNLKNPKSLTSLTDNSNINSKKIKVLNDEVIEEQYQTLIKKQKNKQNPKENGFEKESVVLNKREMNGVVENNIEAKNFERFKRDVEEPKAIIKLKPIEADFSEFGVSKEEQVKLLSPKEYHQKTRKELLDKVKARKEKEQEKKKDYNQVIDDFFK